ncbi:hypothetical protein ACQR36_30175, partial [Rhodococcus erythropolis]|uniref:hypothetical protein n=1 Tax=Rhodococcus erythropolis TaxID=1833 RepID=UPI003D0D5938
SRIAWFHAFSFTAPASFARGMPGTIARASRLGCPSRQICWMAVSIPADVVRRIYGRRDLKP